MFQSSVKLRLTFRGDSQLGVISCLAPDHVFTRGFPGGSVVKNLPANARDTGLIPGSGRSPRRGNGNPLQYSCWKNPMDRGAWWATVHGVTKELDTTERLNNNSMLIAIVCSLLQSQNMSFSTNGVSSCWGIKNYNDCFPVMCISESETSTVVLCLLRRKHFPWGSMALGSSHHFLLPIVWGWVPWASSWCG